jgi:hypothetical protein
MIYNVRTINYKMMSEISILSSESKSRSETIIKKRSRPDPRSFVQFRISIPEHDIYAQVAQELYKQGDIKAPTISALAKASLITQINLWFQIEKENLRIAEEEEKRKKLQAMTGPTRISSRFPNIPMELGRI